MISFTLPRSSAERLSRLGLACDKDSPNIANINLRVLTENSVRFTATTGRILASLVVPTSDLQSDENDLILDQAQLTIALKSALKSAGNQLSCKIDATEARISIGTLSYVVRRVEGQYPPFDPIWTRPNGKQWIPALASIDPNLATLAGKIAGGKGLVFSSFVDPTHRLERLWATTCDTTEVIPVAYLRSAVLKPVYWADHELAILIMQISRSAEEKQLDLSAFSALQPVAMAA